MVVKMWLYCKDVAYFSRHLKKGCGTILTNSNNLFNALISVTGSGADRIYLKAIKQQAQITID